MVDIQAITSGLTRNAEGIWESPGTVAVSYPADGYDSCFAVEETSFWFRHRNECIATVARAWPPGDGTIFDVGGGNGFVATGLARAGFDVVLVEPGPAGARNARRRGLEHVVCATTDSARFQPQSMPAIGLFDVVEHIEHDVAFLRSMRNLLVPGGRLYLTVPAFGWLWSQEDDVAGHFRRYTAASIRQTLLAAGFEVEFLTGLFRFLPPAILLLRALPYRLGFRRSRDTAQQVVRDHVVRRRLTASILDALLLAERRNLERGRSMRFGGSWLVVAGNPDRPAAEVPFSGARQTVAVGDV